MNMKTKTASQKVVLLVLAHHHNKFTNQCNPDVVRISEESCLCRRSVIYALKELKNQGFIDYESAKNVSNVYTLNMPSGVHLMHHSGASNALEPLSKKTEERIKKRRRQERALDGRYQSRRNGQPAITNLL